jgi:hypothetical protein
VSKFLFPASIVMKNTRADRLRLRGRPIRRSNWVPDGVPNGVPNGVAHPQPNARANSDAVTHTNPRANAGANANLLRRTEPA